MDTKKLTQNCLKKAIDMVGGKSALAQILDWSTGSVNFALSEGRVPPHIALRLNRIVEEAKPEILHPKVYTRYMMEAERLKWAV